MASVTVRALGLDLPALQVAEAGLFEDPPSPDAAPLLGRSAPAPLTRQPIHRHA